MINKLFKTTLIGCSLFSNVYADDASELMRLRQENLELKQQLQAVKGEGQNPELSKKEIDRDMAPMPVEDSSRQESNLKSAAQKDFSVTLGTKVWVNRWDTSVPISLGGDANAPGFQVNHSAVISAQEEVTPIPTLNLRYKKFLMGGSYYSQTNFNFDPVITSATTPVITQNNVTNINYQNTKIYNAKREEWDINVGYAITPNIALLTGYKSVRQIFDIQSSSTVTNTSTGQTAANSQNGQYVFDLDGPLLGLALSAPMTSGFGTYVNYMHGFMTEHHSDLNTNKGISSAADYNLIEGGLSYSLNGRFIPAGTPISAASIYAGYRYQWIEIQAGSNQGNKDITQGFAAGANFSF